MSMTGLVDVTPEAGTHLLGGLRQDRVLRRASYPFADPFQNHENSGELPDTGERQQRDDHQETVSEDGEKPVGPCFIREVAAGKANEIAQQFPEPGNKADNRGARTQRLQVRSVHPPCPFVNDIAQEADDTEKED